MDINGIVDIVRENGGAIFVSVYSDELEVPFVLPSVKEARRFDFLLRVASDSISRSQIYLKIFNTYCCDKTLIEPSEDIVLPAGIIETTAKLILWLSGFGEEPIAYTQALLDENRQNSNKLFYTMARTICSVFKAYTFKDVEALDFHQLVEVYSQAEKVLLEAGIIEKGLELGEKKSDSTQKFDVDKEMKNQMRDLARIDAPPEAHKLERGERPPPIRRRRPGR